LQITKRLSNQRIPIGRVIAIKDGGPHSLVQLRSTPVRSERIKERGREMKLANKVAVVTGSSKGIGAAIALRLAAEGASVIVNYHTSKEGADKVVSQIVAAGGSAMAICADVSNEKEIAELFAKTKETYGKVDILVNNAGIYAFGPLEDVTADKYHREHNLNVLGLLLTTKAALPLFPAEGGSIINIGSRVNTVAPAKSVISSASKAAVDAITKVLSKELGPRKIRVNSLNPGVITTEGFILGGLADSPMQKHYVELTPLGRMGEPDDVALPAVFLASDDSRWISGELILVAGGE
jgi:3-oxoacyl-[acyl-carrier protein] reductase